MKVALIGTHGVGKTTLCYELAARLKRRNLTVEMVREVARRCPLPINESTTLAAQEWILHTQMAWELEAAATSEVVVCDRSVLDNYCYLVHAAGAVPAWERMLDAWLPGYDLLVHVPICGEPSFDGVRAVAAGFQQQIDLLLEGMVVARNLRPLRLAPDRRAEWGCDIVRALLPLVDPNLPLFEGEEPTW